MIRYKRGELNSRLRSVIAVILMLLLLVSSAFIYGADEVYGLSRVGSEIGSSGTGARSVYRTATRGSMKAVLDGETLTISGSGAIPSKAFVGTSDSIFGEDVEKVKKIIIEGNITEIGSYAFSGQDKSGRAIGCINVTSVTIKSTNLKLIRLGAFYNCSKLRSVSVPASVTHIQDGSFRKGYTTVVPANKNIKKYGIYGYRCFDNLTINVVRDYSKAFSMLSAVNAKRTKKLTMHSGLLEAAMERAVESIVVLLHTRPNGEPCFTIDGAMIAEVSARGGTDPSAVLTSMMKNATNKKEILDTHFKSVGIGCIQYNGVYYWVMCFGTKTATAVKQPTNRTVKSVIEFPVGTNVMNSSRTHAFKIASGNLRLAVGDTYTTSLTLGGISFIRTEGKWSSDNSSIATVSSGKITAKSAGATLIRAGSTLTNRASVKVNVTKIGRLSGGDRFGTAFAIAEGYKKDSGQNSSKLSNVIVVYGMNFPDALAASFLSPKYKAPIILTNPGAQQTAVVNWMKKHVKANGTAYFVGGPVVVPNSLKTAIQKAGFKVQRVSGADRLGTNLAVLKNVGVPSGSEILVCDGWSFENALIASATGKPMLLVGKGGLSRDQISFVSGKNYKFTIIGNTSSVTSTVESALKKYGTTTRVSAKNADEMSVAVARKYWPKGPSKVFLATSNNFPDALAGGPECIYHNGPIFLVSDKAYTATRNYLKGVAVKYSTSFGGNLVVSDALARKVVAITGS